MTQYWKNPLYFYTIDILDEAITKQKKVAFYHCEYKSDKRLHYRKRSDGSTREYIISPYQMVAREGKYYLICNSDKFENVSNYRIDRIAQIKLLDEPARPFETLQDADNRSLNLEKYMDEHVYMFASDNIRAKFKIRKKLISDVIDMFGDDIKFSDENDESITVSAYVNELSMHQFAMHFSRDVLVLEPKELVDKLRLDADEMVKKYNSI